MSTTASTVVGIIRAISSCVIVTIWCAYYFILPLQNEAKDMHEQQLDPTEIVLIPYSLQRLSIYVLSHILATVLIQLLSTSASISISSSLSIVIQIVLDIITLSWACTMLFIICGGVSTYQHYYHTFLAAMLYVTLSFFQYPSILDYGATNEVDADNSSKYPTIRYRYLSHIVLQQLRGQSIGVVYAQQTIQQQQLQEQPDFKPPKSKIILVLFHQSIVYCCTISTIIFQILLLYDNGYQIQRYPIPIILGCISGWNIGVVIGIIRIYNYQYMSSLYVDATQ